MQFSHRIPLGLRSISAGDPVYIIAEAGVNHGGDMELAKRLIDCAAEAGADAVKFQAFRTAHLILEDVAKAGYQQQTTDKAESQADMLRKLELAQDQYRELKQHCDTAGLTFLITPFDEVSLDELDALDLDAYKVASTDTTNLPFLIKLAQRGKPIFLSTGMSYLSEVEMALKEISKYNRDVVLLQCTANYPILDSEANLNVIETFKRHFNILVGYSDHSVGIGAAPYAVPMGACVVEKHFTLNKDSEGPDHRASLDPQELKAFVRQVRTIEQYLGTHVKKPTISELGTRASLQKCLVATRPISKGATFRADDLIAKRTGGRGISPLFFREVIGRAAPRDFSRDEIIELQ